MGAQSPIVATTGEAEKVGTTGSERRFGKLTVPGRATPLTFRLSGRNGVYGETYMSVSFDFDDDGKFDTEIERYLVADKLVNIGATTFEFSVEKSGDRIALTPLAERKPDRLIIKTGYPAPDFSFVDMNGATRRLSDYRGKVVLLDFWGTWCGPCVAAVPELVALYEQYHARGFEIVGIEANDTREKVTDFISAKHMTWPQTLEKDKGPIAQLYRIEGWPTALLIGPDGKFLAANYLGEVDLKAELAKIYR
jgi:thiol-disulfide isomerase/thioredoxin